MFYPKQILKYFKQRKIDSVKRNYNEGLRRALLEKLDSIPARVDDDLRRCSPVENKSRDWWIAQQIRLFEWQLKDELKFHAPDTPAVREIRYLSCVNFIKMITLINDGN